MNKNQFLSPKAQYFEISPKKTLEDSPKHRPYSCLLKTVNIARKI